MWRTLLRVSLLGTAIIFYTHDVAYGDAFRLPYQGTAAAGQAEAFAAQADDPSALFYNPAGLTQVRRLQIYAGTNLVGGDVTFTSPTGAAVRGDLGGSVAFPPPSHFYITANLKDLGFHALGRMTVGLGLNSPYGLNVRYPNDGPFSTAVTSANLPLLDIKPTLAYKITDMFSIGLGADIYTFASFIGQGHFELKSNLAPGVSTELNGGGTTAGFNASALFTPLRNADGKPLVNLGIVYRSQAILPLQGQFLVNGAVAADAKTTVVLPQVLTGAIAIWPIRDQTREWKLEYDMDFVGWNAFRSLDVRLSNGTFTQTPANWKTIYSLSLGTEYKWLALESLPSWEIALRGGYQLSHTPIPASTFNPAIPDANWHIFAVGLGLLCKEQGRFLGFMNCGTSESGFMAMKAIGLDLAFEAAVFEDRAISGNINPSVNGTYETTLYIGSASLRLMF